MQYGLLALQFGERLPLRVLRSAAGYYLGTFGDEGPASRESLEYWPTRQQAEDALRAGTWTQRLDP